MTRTILAAAVAALILAACGSDAMAPQSTASPAAASSARPTPTAIPTPAATPTPDAEALNREAFCYYIATTSFVVSDVMDTAIAALEDESQAGLESAQATWETEADLTRAVLAAVPEWPRGEALKLQLIRITNDLDNLLSGMVDAATWDDAFAIAGSDAPAITERMNEALATMDSLGFDRGGAC